MDKKKLWNTFLDVAASVILIFHIVNYSPDSKRKSDHDKDKLHLRGPASVINQQNSEQVIENSPAIENTNDPDSAPEKLSIVGVLRDSWRTNNMAVSQLPIAGVTLHLKMGAKNDEATRWKSDFATLKTNFSGAFEFRDLPKSTYTIYWTVPDHYYHEDHYAVEVKESELIGEIDISDRFTIHAHGLTYRCFFKSGEEMRNVAVRLYESLEAYSTVRANNTIHLSTLTAADGGFRLDTAHLPAGRGGVMEFYDTMGNFIGSVGLPQLNPEALTDSGTCED